MDALDREALDSRRFGGYRDLNSWKQDEIPDSFRKYFSLVDEEESVEDRNNMKKQSKDEDTYRQREKEQQKVSKVREVFGQSLPENPGRPRNKRS